MRKLLILAAIATAVAIVALSQEQPALADPADLIVDADDTASVAGGVPDCATGTADSTTIQGGETAASAGDRIFVCPGTYTEDVLVNVTGLTLIGTDLLDKPEVYGQGTLDCVFNVTSPGVEITGFDISSTATPQCGILLLSTADDCELSENFVHDNAGFLGFGGIGVFGSDNCDVHDNTVNDNGDGGMNGFVGIAVTGDGNNIEDNTANHNDLVGIQIQGVGNTAEDNTANHNVGNGIVVCCVDNNDILDNSANRNGGNGILLFATTLNDVIGNAANHNVSNGIRLTSNATGNTVTDNIASHNGLAPTGAHDDDGIHIDGDGNTLTKNKTFHNVDDGIEDHGNTTSTCSTSGPTKNKAKFNGGAQIDCP